MSIRRKLLTIFGALALVTLLVAGVALWETGRWAASAARLSEHYSRSLLTQRVNAATYRALNRAQAAALGTDADARAQFEEAVRDAQRDLASWRKLAYTGAERAQVEAVRGAFVALAVEARAAASVGAAGNRAGAARRLLATERGAFTRFEAVLEAAVLSDRAVRADLLAADARVRGAARTVLLLAALAAVMLALLLAAYLAQDLFGPLRRVREALEEAAQGRGAPLPENRADELGQLAAAHNRLLAELAAREATARAAGSESLDGDADPQEVRRTLHDLASSLDEARTAQGAAQQDALHRATQALGVLSRVAALTLPVSANLAPTDVRSLAYGVATRHHEALARHGASLDLQLAPGLPPARLDANRVREALSELLTNALRVLPAEGGRLGLRARMAGPDLLLEVADNGPGTLDDPRDLAPLEGGERPRLGLKLAREVARAHGGHLDIDARPGVGSRVTLRLPAGL